MSGEVTATGSEGLNPVMPTIQVQRVSQPDDWPFASCSLMTNNSYFHYTKSCYAGRRNAVVLLRSPVKLSFNAALCYCLSASIRGGILSVLADGTLGVSVAITL